MTIDTNDLSFALDSDSEFEKVETQEITHVHLTYSISRELVVNLANRAIVHTLTAIPIANTTMPIGAFIASNFSRYSLDQFYSIIIDIGTLKYSIARYRQFQAL